MITSLTTSQTLHGLQHTHLEVNPTLTSNDNVIYTNITEASPMKILNASCYNMKYLEVSLL